MKVHWSQKWMHIPYMGTSVCLQGIVPELPPESMVLLSMIPDDVQYQGNSEVQFLAEIQILLDQYAHIFSPPDGPPPSRHCSRAIPLVPGSRPVNIRPYRYALAVKDAIERQVSEMLKQGIIQHNTSEFSSLVLLVKKKDGSHRFCVDYRHLNVMTIKNKYPVPKIDELLDKLVNACWFSTLGLAAGYHQIPLEAGEEYKTAFQTHGGHYGFRVMAFGLSGGPATFQKAMNSSLAPLLRKCVLVFFDDILIYSATYKEHLIHIKLVLDILDKDQWKVKLSKCSFAKQEITYLGHVLSSQGVSTDPKKVVAVVSWPTPRNVKEVRSFLGLARYYRKFVRNFGIICKPLTNLLKKGSLFVWTSDHDQAFEALKQAMSSAPVLALPNFSKTFCIETDTNDKGIGAVLM